MKVILTKNVSHVGQMHDVVDVKDGYAQNYLFPQKLAEHATKAKIEALQARRAEIEAKRTEAANAIAEALNALSAPLVVEAKANEEGHLYEKVTAHKVAEALSTAIGHEVIEKHVHTEPITETGDHTVKIALGSDVHEITVQVVAAS